MIVAVHKLRVAALGVFTFGLAQAAQAVTPVACPMIVSSSNWQAHVNAMPGPGARPTLIVRGDVVLRGKDYRLTLRPGPADRSARPVQRFNLIIEPARILSPDERTAQRVEAHAPALGSYRAVTIFCGDQFLGRVENIITAH